MNDENGALLAEIHVPESKEMRTLKTKMAKVKSGVYNLCVVAANDNPVEIDWISFE